MADPTSTTADSLPGERFPRWILCLLVAVLSLAFHGIYARDGIRNLIDLGVLAVDAERVARGQVFAVDFIAPYGPGRYYLLGGLFTVLGPSMNVLLGCLLGVRVLVDLFTFLLARRLMPPAPAVLATLCAACLHGPNHKGFFALALVGVNLGAIRYLTRPGIARAMGLGLIAGAAGLIRYEAGVLGLLAGCMVFGLRWRRGWLPFLAGIVPAVATLLGPVLAAGPLRFLNLELSRAVLLRHADSGIALPWEAIARGDVAPGHLLSLALLAAPFILILYVLFSSLRNAGKTGSDVDIPCTTGASGIPTHRGAALVAITGLIFFSQYVMEPKINRLLQVGPPLFIACLLLAHLVGTRLGRPLPGPAGIFITLVTLLAVPALSGAYLIEGSGDGSQDSIMVLGRPLEKVEGARCGFTTGPKMAREIEVLVGWIRNFGGEEPGYLGPSLPLLYFLAGRENPGPVTDFSYLVTSESLQRETLDALKRNRAGFFIDRPRVIQGFVPERLAPVFFSELKSLFPGRISIKGDFSIHLRPGS